MIWKTLPTRKNRSWEKHNTHNHIACVDTASFRDTAGVILNYCIPLTTLNPYTI